MADDQQQHQDQAASPALPSHDGTDALSNNPRQHATPSSLEQSVTGTAALRQQQRSARKRQCRFFGTQRGCRAGADCLFLHDEPKVATREQQDVEASKPLAREASAAATSSAPTTSRKVPVTSRAPPSRVLRPTPQAQLDDPRAFQLNQIRRRYKPTESEVDGSTVLHVKLAPSDPDFPYDLEALEFSLIVPMGFPKAHASIRVTNAEMGRGYQLNVESGFQRIVERRPDGTLLQWLNTLDKALESLLSQEKAETVKIVISRPKKETSGQATRSPAVSEAHPVIVSSRAREPVYTADQLREAKNKRDIDLRQLEARMGRLSQFSKSSDGVTYTLPIEPRKRDDLPSSLQAVKTFKLIVPQLYHLKPCRIELQGVIGMESESVAKAFEQHCSEHPELSVVAHVNYLSQNIHVFAKTPLASEGVAMEAKIAGQPEQPESVSTISLPPDTVDKDRTHIVTIPRPPEWRDDTASESSDSEFTDSDHDGSNDDTGDEGPSGPEASSSGPERGILLSFPHLEMHGIELMEVFSISLEIKCERCKTQTDVQNIRNNAKLEAAALRSESCRKCANSMSIGYRMDLIHVNSVKAGYLDLDGATVIDMLPSKFIPTCSQCSTAVPQPGVTSVRGDSSIAVCRKCHSKLTFRIPEVKFLRISAAAVRASRAPPRKPKKEQLGIVVGEELPKRGRCKHYSKSLRWFRFSCCSKVFPCDRCHDAESDHPNEHANRMICGYCSREQNFRPEDCGICHAELVGRRGHGFWEGGKGTRDRTKMSRKDPRKYKRMPGSKVGGSSKKK